MFVQKNANLLNEQVEIKLVDTVREEAFCDTGEVYVKSVVFTHVIK